MNKKRSNLRKWLFRIGGMVLLLAVLAVIALAAGLTWLVSENGRVWLAAQIEERVSSEELTVDIGVIEELTSGQAVISAVALKENNEPWLLAEGIRLTYDWRDFFALNPRLESLQVARLYVSRVPGEEEEQDAEEGFTLPTLPELDIGDFRIDDLVLAPELTGREEHLTVSGTLISSPTLYNSRFSLQVTNKATGNRLALVHFTPDRKNDSINLSIAVEDQFGGPLARFFDEKPILVTLEGGGTLADWRGHLNARIGDITADTNVMLDLSGRVMRIVSQGEWSAMGIETAGQTTLRYHPGNGEAEIAFDGTLFAVGYGLEDLDMVLTAEPEEALLDTEVPVRITAKGKVGQVLSMPESEPIADLEDIGFEAVLRQRGSRLEFEQLDLTHQLGTLQATGTADLVEKTIDLTADFATEELSAFRPGLSGAAEGTVSIRGPYDPLDLSGTFDLKTRDLATPWQQMETVFGADPAAEAEFSVTPEGVTLTEGRIRGQETLELEGGVSFEEGVKIDLETAFGGYDIQTSISLQHNVLTASNLNIEGVAGNLSGEVIYDQESGALAGTLTLDSRDAYRITANLGGTAERPVVEGTIEGVTPVLYQFSYSGYALFEPGSQVTLENFQGQFAGNNLRLQQQTTLSLEGENIRLAPATFALEGGTLTVEGGLAAGNQFSLEARGQNLPTDLGIAPFIVPGEMAGTLTLSGPLSDLEGRASLNLDRLAIPTLGDLGEQYLTGTLDAFFQNNLLSLQADLGGAAELGIRAEAQVPLSLIPFNLQTDAPLQGTVSGNLNLEALALMAGLDQHRVRGQLTLDAALNGTIDDPAMSGNAHLEEGYYENIVTGTVLQDIRGRANFSGRQMVIQELAGNGPEGGSFSASGTVDLADLADPQFSLVLKTAKLQIASLDDFGLVVSSDLEARGGGQSALVEGDIVIDYAEYYLDGFGSSSDFAGFTIVERGSPQAEAMEFENVADIPYQIRLSASINANNNIFVRGPDLESEWRADLQVSGTMDDPRLDGRASLIRGRYELLGTPVILTEGVLRFHEAEPPNPTVSLTGLIQGRELDAILQVAGDLQTPSFSLSSDPPLPEDEILAQVLFGSSVNNLSPAQALHIAQMLSSLAGGPASRFDPLNDIRKELGLDVLDVVMDQESGATLSAGKYLNEKVFIAVDQGVTPGSAAVRAEIEVTEDIEVETRFNSTNESSVGVNWKRDY